MVLLRCIEEVGKSKLKRPYQQWAKLQIIYLPTFGVNSLVNSTESSAWWMEPKFDEIVCSNETNGHSESFGGPQDNEVAGKWLYEKKSSIISSKFQKIVKISWFRQISRISSFFQDIVIHVLFYAYFSRISSFFQDIVIFPGYRHFFRISSIFLDFVIFSLFFLVQSLSHNFNAIVGFQKF